MKKSILFGLTATMLTFGPLVAANPRVQTNKTSKPAVSSQSGQTSQPGTTTQSTTTKSGNKTMDSSKVHKLTGTVDSISGDELSITTKSGKKDTFEVGSVKNASTAKAGDHVTVWYHNSNGEKMATKIAVGHGSTHMKSQNTSGTSTSTTSSSKAKTPSSTNTAHH